MAAAKAVWRSSSGGGDRREPAWMLGFKPKRTNLHEKYNYPALVLHCINTYKDGCSASEARQAVGEGRGAVVTGTHLAEAIHRLALWVGGLSTVAAICTLRQH
jgi:hypothetical protein